MSHSRTCEHLDGIRTHAAHTDNRHTAVGETPTALSPRSDTVRSLKGVVTVGITYQFLNFEAIAAGTASLCTIISMVLARK